MKNPEYSVRFDQKAEVFVAYSHRLNLFSQAFTPEESITAVRQAEKSYDELMAKRQQEQA
jgi:hypothetical protein